MEYDKATADFNAVIRLDPKNVYAYFGPPVDPVLVPW